MVITVEPGCYFNMPWIDAQLKTQPHKGKFVDLAVLERFATFGGVRLEDDVVVTADGIENLTVVPRELNDVEEVLALARGR
jgi:Xaa-Pro dipeptidase